MYAFVILKDDVTESDEDIIKELKALVRQKIAAYAVPDIIQVRTYWYGHKGLPRNPLLGCYSSLTHSLLKWVSLKVTSTIIKSNLL